MQLNRRFEFGGKTPRQRSFDEIAVQTAEQLRRALTAQVEVCEIIHELSVRLFHTEAYIDITRYSVLCDA